MKILISTANYNSEKDTIDLISNLEKHSSGNENIDISLLIFDNSRTLLDEFIQTNLDVKIIKPCRNIGLAPTWKVSMSYMLKSDYDCLILVNNDTEFSDNFFDVLALAMINDVDCAYGAYITLPDDTPWSTGGQFGYLPWMIKHEAKPKEYYEKSVYPTEHLSGCCIILPRENIEKNYRNLIGLSDFFFRGEEWFINRRFEELRVNRFILRDAVLVHKENGSHVRFSVAHIYWAIRAKLLYIKKLNGIIHLLSLSTYIMHVYTKGMVFYKGHSEISYIALIKVISKAVKDGFFKNVIRERDFR